MTATGDKGDTLEEVRLAMAEHFLDTENRHELAHTAGICVEAGLDTAQVRMIWRDEVAPVLGSNLLAVAGEWAGWDRERLLREIAERRARESGWLGRWRNRWSRRLRPANRGDLDALDQFVVLLRQAPTASSRDQTVADLLWLGRCFFAMTIDVAAPSSEDRQRLRRRFQTGFRPAIAPALLKGEGEIGDRRIGEALADIDPVLSSDRD